MKAKTKNQYISAWTSHVNQLIHPAIDGDRRQIGADLDIVCSRADEKRVKP